MENVIFKAKVGSHAYGTNIEGSDEDFKGIFIQSPEDVLIRGYQEQQQISKDETYYELRRFIDLCCTGNPTMLEVLFSPEDCIIHKDPTMNPLISIRQQLLSKSCRFSFGGYAYSQIAKAKGLEKKMNWESTRVTRRGILDFCYILTPNGSTPFKDWLSRQRGQFVHQHNYGVSAVPHCRDMYYIYPKDRADLTYGGLVNADESSNELRLDSIPRSEMLKGIAMSYNKDGYLEHCKDYKSYQIWLEQRNTQRYIDIDGHGQKIDGKNLLHCYRLLETGIEIAKYHTINVRRPNASFLIEIRKGKHDLEKLLKEANSKILELDKAYEESTLPGKVDRSPFAKIMIKMRQEYYGK